MAFSNNISTNIIRDAGNSIDFIVTPNTLDIYNRIFEGTSNSNRSFTLIGNYGTGKSTFLWALEKSIKKEKVYFSEIPSTSKLKGFDFIKLIGSNMSISNSLTRHLSLPQEATNGEIIDALEKLRVKASKKSKGLILLIDEFGKFLEYAASNNALGDLYLMQLIAEWANDARQDCYFIITLHQNFASYGQALNSQDRIEWEKVKGRFIDLLFNEPVDQLIYFASKRLEEFKIPTDKKREFFKLNELIDKSNLVGHSKISDSKLTESLYPLDWLSSYILVNALQRYGQNERSLFSFLHDSSKYSITQNSESFYTVSSIYNYLINILTTEINGPNNPHKSQWSTTLRALEKAELLFDDQYLFASEIIKTIGLVNIFSKSGGLFDKSFIVEYFKLTKELNAEPILNTLSKAGIIRFYKHSNKINFLEGTDLDLEQELIQISKEINHDISFSNELPRLITFPLQIAKRFSYQTGTTRLFEFKIIQNENEICEAEGIIDGYINLVFDQFTEKTIKSHSQKSKSNLFVSYRNTTEIRDELISIKKFDQLLRIHKEDRQATILLNDEREYHLQNLNTLVLSNLFNSETNIWYYVGKKISINNKNALNEKLSEVCEFAYPETPILKNELINKEILSTPINIARRNLFRQLLAHSEKENLSYDINKFPPDKAIYLSLLKVTGIHKKNKSLNYYELSAPRKGSALYNLWEKCENFLDSTTSTKRNLNELYDQLSIAPFKLKRGFIEFWIPIFLISKKEEFALFHNEGGFIPYITEDILSFIQKNPAQFVVKCYNVSGLKVNLLEGYRELTQFNQDKSAGRASTFLAIFGNFLRFQRSLNGYALKTMKLSDSAIKLRDAIQKAKDPEEALFDTFPASLGFHSIGDDSSVETLESFINQLQESIKELRTCYDGLLNRIEDVILDSFFIEEKDFDSYKNHLNLKLSSIDVHLLGSKQNIFFQRVMSPLDDRAAWLKSVADVALGKSLFEIIDEEENLLFNNIRGLALGLTKATEMHQFNNNSKNEKMYTFKLFDVTGEIIEDKVVVKKASGENKSPNQQKIISYLEQLDPEERKGFLLQLLSKEINRN